MITIARDVQVYGPACQACMATGGQVLVTARSGDRMVELVLTSAQIDDLTAALRIRRREKRPRTLKRQL